MIIMDGPSFDDYFGNMVPIVSSTTTGQYSASTSSEDKRHTTGSSSFSTFVDSFRNKNENLYIHDKISQSTPLESWSSRGTSHIKETDTVSNISILDYSCVSSPMNQTCCTFVDKNPYLPTLQMFSYTEETDTIDDCDCVSPIIIVAERSSPRSKQQHLTFPTMPDFSSSLTMASYTEYIDEENANDDVDDEQYDLDDACTFIESNKHMMKDDHNDDDGCVDDDCSFGASDVVDISRSLSLNHTDSFTERMHCCTPTTPTTTATTTTKTTTTMHTMQSPFHESITLNATKNSSYPTRTVSPKKQFKSLSSSLQHQQRLIPVMLNTTSKTPQRRTTSKTAKYLVNNSNNSNNNNNTTTNHNHNKKNVHGWNNMRHKNGCDITTNNHNQETKLQRYERSLFLLDDDGMMLNNNIDKDEKTNNHPKHKLYYRQAAG